MKRLLYLFALFGITMCTSCSNELNEDVAPPTNEQSKLVTFTFGEFSYQAMTRASMSELKMTDLWMFDYIGDELQQTIHQSSDDEDFGVISASMAYGNHTLYFVTSRGTTPTVDTNSHIISWIRSSDTFWATSSLNVTSASSNSQSIELMRAVTKLKIAILDKVPEGTAKAVITPSQWYFGIDYKTGVGTTCRTNTPINVTIPESYIGTTGDIVLSVMSFVPSDEWHTDVTCAIKTSDDIVLGTVTLGDVSLSKNITTIYSGNIFNSSNGFTLTADDTWEEENSHSW